MKEYMKLGQRIIDDGVWVENERTGKKCKVVLDVNMTYDMRNSQLPVLTTKKVNWKSAIAEMLGYLRGYTSAADFRGLGCNTWNMNANENKSWLENKFRKGVDDMGRCYGAQGRDWKNPEGESIDQLKNVYEDLKRGVDNRSEIVTFMNPGERDRACLNSCMHTHTFSILDGMLYLTSYQRSDDVPLGHAFNQVQVGWLLLIMAQITGLKAGLGFHKIVNAHIYEDQYDTFCNVQMKREPKNIQPVLNINPKIKTLNDLETWVTIDDFELVGYEHDPYIKFPFSV